MIDSKLTFKIQEIPDGNSSRQVHLEAEDLDFEELSLKHAVVEIQFLKTLHFIKAEFRVDAVMILTCDRSLEEFDQKISGEYEVLFKPDADETSVSEKGRVKQFNIYELTLSLDQEVRDTILLELPAKRLHPRFIDKDGKPVEFETRTFGRSEEDDEEVTDPRWEALKKLKN